MTHMTCRVPCLTGDQPPPWLTTGEVCKGATHLPAAGGWARTQADLRAHVPLGGCIQWVHVVHLRRQPRRLACELAATVRLIQNHPSGHADDSRATHVVLDIQDNACQFECMKQAAYSPWLARAEGRRAMLPDRIVSDSRLRR